MKDAKLTLEGVIEPYTHFDNEENLEACGTVLNHEDLGIVIRDWLLENDYDELPSRTDVHVRITIEVTDVTTREPQPKRTRYLLNSPRHKIA